MYWLLYNTKILILMVVLLAGSLGLAYYFYDQNQKARHFLANPELASEEEKKALLKTVGALIEMPNEAPNIITVQNKDDLVNQPFFKGVENGDKIIVFSGAKQAIVFRPSSGKIVKVGPVEVSQSDIKNFKIAVATAGDETKAIDQVEKILKEQISNIEVLKAGFVLRNKYSQTLVVDIQGNKKTEAEQIARAVGGKVAVLPEGEKKPEADFLIILNSLGG